jgi:hypothetical protein
MNDRPGVPASSSLSALRTAEERAPTEDTAHRKDDSEELDKYDLSTLACTD